MTGCFGSSEKETSVLRFPVSGTGDIVDSQSAEFDAETSFTGGDGSILVEAGSPVTLSLFTPDPSGLNHSRIVYKARLKTEDLKGEGEERGIAFLELRTLYSNGEEVIARGPRIPPTGTTDWIPVETDLYLDTGPEPEKITLALGVEGRGKVWVDDVVLESRPLRIDYLFWGSAVVWIALIIYIYHLFTKQRSLRRELESIRTGA
jgi:CcmD family protein